MLKGNFRPLFYLLIFTLSLSWAPSAVGDSMVLGGVKISFPEYLSVRRVAENATGGRVIFTVRKSPRRGPGEKFPLRVSLPCSADEFLAGITERVIDGDSKRGWSPEALRTGLNQRGERFSVLVRGTLGAFVPMYVSGAGYALRVHGTWPGVVDFCRADRSAVVLTWEGPQLELEFFWGDVPTAVAAATRSLGPPVHLPPWAFRQWRWRNDVEPRATYFDGTRARAPYNSQVVEDILVSEALDIPLGVYWIDRPWSTGALGYDSFMFDPQRLPNAAQMIAWIHQKGIRTGVWLGPWLSGPLGKEAVRKNLALRVVPLKEGPVTLLDFTNPRTADFLAHLLKPLLGLQVAAFKLDRGDQDVPDSRQRVVAAGISEFEHRNDFPRAYQATIHGIVEASRGSDFALLSRASYAGSSRYTAIWGGDVGADERGLRATIIGMQRAALMGLPYFGSDTGGYVGTLDREITARWFALSAFSPIMEVGPLENRAPWDWPTGAGQEKGIYDPELVAIYRFYSVLREALVPLFAELGAVAANEGVPIVRPMVLAFPADRDGRDRWDQYLVGDSLLVAPVWEKSARAREVYLPRGSRWRDAWLPERIYPGGQTIRVLAPLEQIPLFIREGSTISLPDLPGLFRDSVARSANLPMMRKLEEGAFR